MVLEVLALVVLGVLVAAAIALVVVLGRMPGKIARGREHPQADAVGVLGWIGVVTLGLAWPVALVWAYTRPSGAAGVEERVASLEARILELEGAQGGAES
jgi:hypothetical protein